MASTILKNNIKPNKQQKQTNKMCNKKLMTFHNQTFNYLQCLFTKGGISMVYRHIIWKIKLQ